ncbi:Hachiman antiphage defense system protein HamA [Acidihalobacter aeolianus]|nr:Hachiman antiphage defense system protein HamA [Acidihalobacter aeolianus]
MNPGLLHFIRARREPIEGDKEAVRLVYRSELVRNATGSGPELDQYVADRAPLFYRSVDSIMDDLRAGYFLTAVKDTLAKLPTSKSFQTSHFGEIVAGIFAEEVLGLRRLYSKLSLLSAENANPYKMDLVLYDPDSVPIKFIFGEVKCSPKVAADGLPTKHDASCFSDLFNSMNKYQSSDRNFDLAAARDNLGNIPTGDRDRVRDALKPYSGSEVGYAGFVIIDTSTFDLGEAQVLRTRKNNKEFEVDLV